MFNKGVTALEFAISVLLGCLNHHYRGNYEWKANKGFRYKIKGDVNKDKLINVDVVPLEWIGDDEPYIAFNFRKDEDGRWIPTDGLVYAPHIYDIGIRHQLFNVIAPGEHAPFDVMMIDE